MCLCCTTSLEPFLLLMRFPGSLNLSTSLSGGMRGWNMVVAVVGAGDGSRGGGGGGGGGGSGSDDWGQWWKP